MGNGEVGFKNLNPFMQGVLVLLSILLIILPPMSGFIILGRDVQDNKKRSEGNAEGVVRNLSSIHVLEIGDARQETRDLELLRRMDELKAEIGKWEPIRERDG